MVPGSLCCAQVPFVELRRLLAEARASGEAFTLTYRARDRAHGGWRRVKVAQRGEGHSTCRVLRAPLQDLTRRSDLLGAACTDEERVLLGTAPPAWAMRSLLFFPFPMKIEDGIDAQTAELGCLS